jgi:hypothetical protein
MATGGMGDDSGASSARCSRAELLPDALAAAALAARARRRR